MTKNLSPLILTLILSILTMGCSEKNTLIDWTYPNGKYKALIMSYDDGLVDDIALAQLFDHNGIVGTFHLNSGFLDTKTIWNEGKSNEILHTYLPKDTLKHIFKNHEIAVHGTYHKALVGLSDKEILEEKTKMESWLTSIDWIESSHKMLDQKSEWTNLDIAQQNNWKKTFFGLN